MPRSLSVRVERRGARPIRIWVPVLPALLVFSPAVMPAVLAGAVACLVYRISVLRALGTGLRIVAALPGTRFDIEQGRAAVLVAIR